MFMRFYAAIRGFSDNRHQTHFVRRVDFVLNFETRREPFDSFLDVVRRLAREAETQFVRPGFIRVEKLTVSEDDARRNRPLK